MKIEEKEYSKEEFKRYMLEHSEKIFEVKERKSWLKIYSLLVENDKWKTNLFSSDELQQMGEIFKAKLIDIDEDGNRKETIYYAYEEQKGLLLLYTTANKDDYEKSLGKRIENRKGVTKMWINPTLFGNFWNGILADTKGYIYRFSSNRNFISEHPSKIRPTFERRIIYSGKDANQSLDELSELYGVAPYSVSIRVSENLKLKITNDGLYSAQEASAEALQLFYKHLETIKKPILSLSNISKSFKFNFVEEAETKLKIPSISAGIIELKSTEIDEETIKEFTQKLENFSFVDKHTEVGSLSFTATVIDKLKDSVFDISASSKQILIVPKVRSTFESFLEFYRNVVDIIDPSAELSLVKERG